MSSIRQLPTRLLAQRESFTFRQHASALWLLLNVEHDANTNDTELQDKARMACGGGAGGGGMPAPGATTPPVTTPIQTPPVTPVVTPNVTVPTGIFPPPGGNVTPPAGTPTSPSVFTGAAATAAIGQFVGAAGVAAAAVAFGL